MDRVGGGRGTPRTGSRTGPTGPPRAESNRPRSKVPKEREGARAGGRARRARTRTRTNRPRARPRARARADTQTRGSPTRGARVQGRGGDPGGVPVRPGSARAGLGGPPLTPTGPAAPPWARPAPDRTLPGTPPDSLVLALRDALPPPPPRNGPASPPRPPSPSRIRGPPAGPSASEPRPLLRARTVGRQGRPESLPTLHLTPFPVA